MLSHKNPALATWTGIALVLGVGGYLVLGMKLDRKLLPSALTLVIFGLFVGLPALQLFGDLKDTWKKYYASKHEHPYLVQIDRIIQNSNLPMKLNLKSSNYDSLYYEGSISLNVEKTTEEPVAKTELNTLLNLLPEAAKDIHIRVAFGSYSSEPGMQEPRVSFTISPDKELENCSASPGYESLCYRYDKDTGFDPTEVLYSNSTSINAALPPFTFTVYGVKKEILSTVTRITVTNPDDKDKFIQELIFDETSTQDDHAFGFVLEDMNFDGYLDVRIQADTPAGPNIPYYCWL
ncbi:hypothetical protein [Bacillus sp. FJAT-27264]|uniref:hypothetical protein n=1 Tax=Paenibacillus sp. (strain DSM 101736 / FJAT-27264) TaxID=1850362 RepID=UPI001585EBCC|nr:hypothetical protein [Bacillus sp. FJAT-27264]